MVGAFFAGIDVVFWSSVSLSSLKDSSELEVPDESFEFNVSFASGALHSMNYFAQEKCTFDGGGFYRHR